MSELTEMEKYLQKMFTEAGHDLQKKFLKYTQDFQRLEAQKQAAVDKGDMTEEEFAEWRKNKLLYGMHWRRLIDRNTAELVKYNQTALKYINGETPQIFAAGYNSVAEKIPDSPVGGFDFELINANTVSNLIHEEGIILPKKKLDPQKDKAWNAKQINAQILQGIMQGESIPKMAKRMQTVANSDLAGATRTARTMHTAAQNAGRQSGYNKAAKQGIIFEKTWISARQINRTRDTHYALHGTTVPYNEKFVTKADNELEFPGDWRAPAEEVYNCRCTMITKFKGFMKLKDAENVPDRETPKGNKAEDYEWIGGKPAAEKAEKEQEQPKEQEEKTTSGTYPVATTRKEAESVLYGDNGIFKSSAYSSYGSICDDLMIAISNTLGELENTFGVVGKFTEAHKGRKSLFAEYWKKKAIAACCMDDGSMYFNPKYFKTVNYHTKTVLKSRDDGHFMPFSDENALKYAYTHEYGHAVEGYYAYQMLKSDEPDKAYADVKAEIIEIAKKNNPKIDPYSELSIYGMKDDAEFFAECFANSRCGKPNELGKAMTEWLEQKGFLK